MGHFSQNINLPLSARAEILNTGGLVATPFTGVVNDAVLLFTALGVITGPPAGIVQANDANAGTSVTLFQPGVYDVKLYLQQLAAQTTEYGISQDVAAAGLIGDPSFAIAGFLEVRRSVSIAGQTAEPLGISTTVFVNAAQAANGTVIRFHATDGAGAAPAADFTAAACYYRIQRINQNYGV